MKNNKRELSALFYRHSCDEHTAVESQSNGFYLNDEAVTTILSFVLKTESEGHNIIKLLEVVFFLFARILGVQNEHQR